MPFVEEQVDDVFDGRGQGPVVLRGDEDVSVEGGDEGGPGAGDGVGVVWRWVGFVELRGDGGFGVGGVEGEEGRGLVGEVDGYVFDWGCG